jgi:hypothetical protein
MNEKHVELLQQDQRAIENVTKVHDMPLGVPVVQSSGPMRLLEIAVNRGASVEELEKLMALAERHDANVAKKAYVEAMAKFKQNPPRIEKNRTADITSRRDDAASYAYKYANLADVCDKIVAGLAQVGISHRWKTQQDGGQVAVTCILTHEMGHSESTMLSAGLDQSGKKNSLQALGSTVSYLNRYTLLAATGLAVDDGADDDGAGVAPEDRKELQREAAGMRNSRRPNPQDVAESRKPAARAKPVDPQLLADAQAAADQGRNAFDVFWKSINGEKRTALGAHLEDFATRCDRADAPGAA